jgi:small multidrug resistance pump
MTWVLLAAAIAAEVTATLCMRASEGLRKRIWIIPIAAGYLASFVLLAVVLDRGMPVGIAYGIWSAIGVALTAIAGRVIYAEPLTWVMGIGIVLIAGGVLLIELGMPAS